MDIIDLGEKREFFWDDYLIDTEKTTAFPRLMHPEKKETCLWFDKDETKDVLMFFSIIKDDKGYKLYYINWDENDVSKRYLAVAESKDGITWIKPDLKIFDHPELKGHNNVVIDPGESMFVFYDENPDCPKEEKYKVVSPYYNSAHGNALELWAYVSGDGYRFRLSHCIETDGHFDSQNTAHYKDGKYACYFRSFHDKNGNDTKVWSNDNLRDIRVIYSDDFRTWTKQKRLEFSDGKDYPLYTNCIFPYERAPQILIGFPARYFHRTEWTANDEQLPSADLKKKLIKEVGKREGLSLTDCVFMCSRDGVKWNRYNEAFMTSGYENEYNWIYGDNNPAWGLIDSGKETYYMYAMDKRRSYDEDKPLYRYEIRKDGFACYMADGDEKTLVTKPLIYEGKVLHLNFSTSAYGYIYIDVLDENGNELSGKTSFEIFGDTIDRKILFSDGSDFSAYAGKPVRLRFRLRDAKLFSLKFE